MELTREQKILQRVLSEAWNNPSYKQELISNPKEAIHRLTGENFSIPEGKTLEICDQSNSEKVYLNIPQQPNFDNVELTDKELEEVAGGMVISRYIRGLKDPFNPPISSPGGSTSTGLFSSVKTVTSRS